MKEVIDVAQLIIEAGTPERCVGCHTPVLKGYHLSDQVEAGTMTEDEAVARLREELEENCKYGHSVVPRLGQKCMNLVVCSPSAVPVPREKRRWDWEPIDI